MALFCKRLILICVSAIILFQLCGCGETVHGIGKDWGRVGKGIKTIFVRESK